MKKVWGLLGAVVVALSLTACGNSSGAKSSSSSSVKTKKVIKASDNSSKEKEKPQETKGALIKPGQFKMDKDQGKVSLVHIYHPTTAIDDKKITIKFADVKVLKTETNNDSQLNYWSDYWQDHLTNPYYYLQVDMEVTNQTGQDITLEGIKAVVFDGRAYSYESVMDTTGGLAVPNNSTTKDAMLTIPIAKDAVDKTDFGFAFNDIGAGNSPDTFIPAMSTVTIDLTK